jgi:perosamine synthetase
MTNLQAALGLAQLERIDELVAKRRLVMAWYRAGLRDQASIRLNMEAPWARSVYWMVCVSVDNMNDDSREHFMAALRSAGVDSRPYFYPIADMPMYADAQTPVTRRISQAGVNLPSYFDLTEEEVLHICSVVLRVLREMGLS